MDHISKNANKTEIVNLKEVIASRNKLNIFTLEHYKYKDELKKILLNYNVEDNLDNIEIKLNNLSLEKNDSKDYVDNKSRKKRKKERKVKVEIKIKVEL